MTMKKMTLIVSLRLLVWEGYAPRDEQDAFIRHVRQKYNVGLTFSIRFASSPDDYFDALRKGEVDIISPAHNLPKDFRYRFITNGLTLPFNLDLIPNYDAITDDLRYQHWATHRGDVFAVPVLQGPYGIAYNADLIREAPRSWNIFWDPRYAGKYMVSGDYYELNIYISALALGYRPEEIFSYDMIKGGALERRVHQLAVNAHSFWTGFDKATHFKGKALATSWRSTFPELNALGEKWRIAVPEEGTTWWTDTLMIGHSLKRQPLLRRIAEEWINHLLDPVVQTESLALRLGIYPVTTPALALYRKRLADSPDAANQNRLLAHHISWKVLGTRSRNAFSLLWREALEAREKIAAERSPLRGEKKPTGKPAHYRE
jgi:spermidine/putrescine-binding protein